MRSPIFARLMAHGSRFALDRCIRRYRGDQRARCSRLPVRRHGKQALPFNSAIALDDERDRGVDAVRYDPVVLDDRLLTTDPDLLDVVEVRAASFSASSTAWSKLSSAGR
jgi:hypothetical protein